ncbi:hypothetical protein KAT08_03785 [Candidatus Babeliales bacterium]|nr:hypothetical protein [Candidatus Babeliales bacterium]
MKLKRIIEIIKENLVNNDVCDECNQLLTECKCEHNRKCEKEEKKECAENKNFFK